MTPTPEIIDLAKRFHAAEGCEGRKCSYGDWYYCAQTGNAELYVSMEDDWKYYADAGDIPILDESELWAWLYAHAIVTIDISIILVQIRHSDIPQYEDEVNNLWVSLYEAACWVAEQEKK